MAYYKDLREYLQKLEESGKLIRIKSQINKDTQMHPLVRLQFRGLPEEQRKAFLFENVIDSRGRQFNIPVLVAALAGSLDIYALGMMCKPEEIGAKFNQAQLHPIEPKMVDSGPVYEEVHIGDSLLEHGGLDEFPIPISTPGYDAAPYIAASAWITKDPETGIRNVGTYRAQVKAPLRTGISFDNLTKGGAIHWVTCKEKGIPLEAAIVIGGPPSLGYVSSAKIPRDVDEFSVAGGIAGEPVELVKCKTVDLEVPANAEVVIEGELSSDMVEPEAPFGESRGFVGLTDMFPYFTIKCIAHRKKPIWLTFISQFPPSESTKLRQPSSEAILYEYLRDELKMLHVLAVSCHEAGSSGRLFVIQMKKAESAEVWRTLEEAVKRFPMIKIIVAVDEDINPRDMEAVSQSMCQRMIPHRDCRIQKFDTPLLIDPSFGPIDELEKERESSTEKLIENSRLLIDTTIKWPYPPISLPKKEFMDEALRLWQKEGLPELKLKEPWWGQNLGYWSPEDEEKAALAVKGEYYRTGDNYAIKRRPG
ncbi:UbiD family decarboxylase [Chloroflexota bacterium]